jgi:hypothetical protein
LACALVAGSCAAPSATKVEGAKISFLSPRDRRE